MLGAPPECGCELPKAQRTLARDRIPAGEAVIIKPGSYRGNKYSWAANGPTREMAAAPSLMAAVSFPSEHASAAWLLPL